MTFNVGDKVKITRDGDGPNGRTGVIHAVYRSGRCKIIIDGEPGWRNMPPADFVKLETEDAE